MLQEREIVSARGHHLLAVRYADGLTGTPSPQKLKVNEELSLLNSLFFTCSNGQRRVMVRNGICGPEPMIALLSLTQLK